MSQSKNSIAPIRPVTLCIMDGWGLSDEPAHNAVSKAQTPVFDKLRDSCPYSQLAASEEAVGLPKGQPGNSEVGHLTIGSGRLIEQDLPRISRACKTGELAQLPALIAFITDMKQSGATAHLTGLTSHGGVHAHIDHIVALAHALCDADIPVCLHLISDGRDTLPQTALHDMPDILARLPDKVMIASLTGRYFAMDRDKRWERTQQFLDVLVGAKAPNHAQDAISALEAAYRRGETDEFITPTSLGSYDGFAPGDAIIMANFRVDRARQIMSALFLPETTDCAFGHLDNRVPLTGPGLAMTPLSDKLDGMVPHLFSPPDLSNGLGEIVARAGLRQLRLAETEKYPHVTFFFNGGQENRFPDEERTVVPSPKVATYDLQPEMSAADLRDVAVAAVQNRTHHLIIVNFANPDMVGHTGDLSAAITAVETVDRAVGELVTATLAVGGHMIVTADHGNCEVMWDSTAQSVHTAHTTNPVPCLLVGADESATVRDGTLADLAPSLLSLLTLEVPDEMTGTSLISHKVT